mgnify:CR=1 FL=1|jgi:hypothetical protein
MTNLASPAQTVARQARMEVAAECRKQEAQDFAAALSLIRISLHNEKQLVQLLHTATSALTVRNKYLFSTDLGDSIELCDAVADQIEFRYSA